MAARIVLDRISAKKKYETIIDVCERRAAGSSLVNALAEMVFESRTYKKIREQMDEEAKNEEGNNSQEKPDPHGGGST